MKKILSLALAAAMTLSLAACSSSSDDSVDFSKESVTCIVPFDAGGGTDLVMRGLADAASDEFKSITVENRSGAGGATGMLYGASAATDGTVVTMITVELVTLEATGMNAGLTYSQFKPIMMVNSAAASVTVKADDDRFNSLEDFIVYSQSNSVNVGNSGIGSIWHLAAAALEKAADTAFTHVGFDGAAPAITDLLGGHIDAITVSYAEVSSYVESGDLKVLAVMSSDRLPSAPDVPTCAEEGYEAVVGTWRGLGVPADTSDEIVDELYRIFSEASESEAFVQFMADTKNDIDILNGADYSVRLGSELDLFTALVAELGLAVG